MAAGGGDNVAAAMRFDIEALARPARWMALELEVPAAAAAVLGRRLGHFVFAPQRFERLHAAGTRVHVEEVPARSRHDPNVCVRVLSPPAVDPAGVRGGLLLPSGQDWVLARRPTGPAIGAGA